MALPNTNVVLAGASKQQGLGLVNVLELFRRMGVPGDGMILVPDRPRSTQHSSASTCWAGQGSSEAMMMMMIIVNKCPNVKYLTIVDMDITWEVGQHIL